MHPDDVLAGSTLERVGIAGIEKLEIVDSLFPLESFTGNIVALGGPMSNYLSRQVLDYIPVSNAPEDGFAKRNSKPFFELPYEYAYSHTKSYTKLKTERIDAGSVLHDLEHDTLLLPNTDSSGHLTSDYLLITVLPNILSKKAYDEGNKMIVFAGTHGVGTRAIELLFQDTSVLQTLVRKVHGVNYWQAVIEVVEIIKPTQNERAKPFAISQKIRCRPVHLNEAEIEKHIKV
ncbi:hypothetical protein KAR91_66145 [Candidatus Pacearchaeota archaeon]|nr:hypothetical protein [Candidatus Pacearchaeota archaeon]